MRSSSDADVALDPALDPNTAWAIAFRDSLNPDPLMQIVLQCVENAKKANGDEVSGAAGTAVAQEETI